MEDVRDLLADSPLPPGLWDSLKLEASTAGLHEKGGSTVNYLGDAAWKASQEKEEMKILGPPRPQSTPACLEKLWDTLVATPAGYGTRGLLSRGMHVQLGLRLYSLLLPPPINYHIARGNLEADWDRCLGKDGVLSKEDFNRCMMELGEMWCSRHNASQSVVDRMALAVTCVTCTGALALKPVHQVTYAPDIALGCCDPKPVLGFVLESNGSPEMTYPIPLEDLQEEGGQSGAQILERERSCNVMAEMLQGFWLRCAKAKAGEDAMPGASPARALCTPTERRMARRGQRFDLFVLQFFLARHKTFLAAREDMWGFIQRVMQQAAASPHLRLFAHMLGIPCISPDGEELILLRQPPSRVIPHSLLPVLERLAASASAGSIRELLGNGLAAVSVKASNIRSAVLSVCGDLPESSLAQVHLLDLKDLRCTAPAMQEKTDQDRRAFARQCSTAVGEDSMDVDLDLALLRCWPVLCEHEDVRLAKITLGCVRAIQAWAVAASTRQAKDGTRKGPADLEAPARVALSS
ncbi:unnamed protein product [Chrysoparadoxa australica]